MLRLIGPALALCLAPAGPVPAADAPCRQALALGLDVSGSVDDREYRLQVDGLARALDHPQVRAALFEMPGAPVRLMVYEWSGPRDQRVLAPWREISGPAALDALRAELGGARRARMEPSTAIGPAMRLGAAELAGQAGCWRRVLDLSGDGTHNTGPHPRAIAMDGVVVNGLVIGGAPGLADYFRAYVLRGPDSFVERAAGFADFEAAMVRKLLRELRILPLAGSGRGGAHGRG